MGGQNPPLYLLVEWSVHPDKESDFEREIARMKGRILERGHCRFMHVYFNRSERRAHAVEQFRDAQEVLEHLGTVSDLMEDFYATCAIAHVSVLGYVTAELSETLGQLQPLFPDGEPKRAPFLTAVLPAPQEG